MSDVNFEKTVKLISWLSESVDLTQKFEQTTGWNNSIPQGTVCTCYLGENLGNEKSGTARPVIVISNDTMNKTSNNIVIAPLSTKIKYDYTKGKTALKYPTHYVLKTSNYTLLKKDSVIQLEDMRSLSKIRIGKSLFQVSKTDFENIKKRVKRVFDL